MKSANQPPIAVAAIRVVQFYTPSRRRVKGKCKTVRAPLRYELQFLPVGGKHWIKVPVKWVRE